jgi:hypothetical protein
MEERRKQGIWKYEKRRNKEEKVEKKIRIKRNK